MDPAHTRPQIRIEHLYRIGERLARFGTIETTFSEVLTIASATLELRSAILIVARPERFRTIVWPADGVSPESVQRAEEHAQRLHHYFTDAAEGPPREPPEIVRRVLPPLPAGVPGGYLVVPLVVDRSRAFGIMQVEGAAPFDEPDLAFVNVIANQLAVAIDRDWVRQQEVQLRRRAEALGREARAGRERFELLSEASVRLAASSDYAVTLAQVLQLLVPRFADAAALTIRESARPMRFVAGAGDDLAAVGTLESRVLETGEPLTEAREGAGALAVPLRLHGETIGAMTLLALERERPFARADVALAEDLARRIATAIDNAHVNAEALDAVRWRDDLLGVVSHDLMNPLSVILMNVTRLSKAPEGLEERRSQGRRQLESLRRAAERMSRLVQDLLDVARIERGRLPMKPQRTEVVPLIAEAVESMQPLAGDKAIRIENEVAGALPPVLADSARVHQVVANIIGNAIKFSPPGARISVRCAARATEVEFSIEDSGPGIATDEIPHLFDRFWQSRRTAGLGTGLGLFIAKSVVLAHGGRIWVETELGAGTTFFFTLPALPLEARETTAAHAPP